MELRFVRLIAEKREELWTGQSDYTKLFGLGGAVPRDTSAGASSTPGASERPGPSARLYGPLDHLRYIREKRGEKIVALDKETGQLLGWVGLLPDRDEGGPFFRLAGIEVHADHRGKGIGSGLMHEAEAYIRTRRAARIKFGTTPLLTQNAGLHVTRFGARYRWKESVKTPEGRPWPYVTCVCDFDDPLAKTLDIRDAEVISKSVIDWQGRSPVPRAGISYTGPLTVVLPDLSPAHLADAIECVPGFLETMYRVFQELYMHGYEFAWFDVIATSPGNPPVYYYAMKRLLAL